MDIPYFFSSIYSSNSIFYINEIFYKLKYIKNFIPNHKICNLLSAYFIEITDTFSPIISEDSLKKIYEEVNELYTIINLIQEFKKLLPIIKNNKKISSRKRKFYKRLFKKQLENINLLEFKNMSFSLFMLKKEMFQEIQYIKKEKCFFRPFSPSLSTIIEI